VHARGIEDGVGWSEGAECRGDSHNEAQDGNNEQFDLHAYELEKETLSRIRSWADIDYGGWRAAETMVIHEGVKCRAWGSRGVSPENTRRKWDGQTRQADPLSEYPIKRPRPWTFGIHARNLNPARESRSYFFPSHLSLPPFW
jgi:hypothetical protein